MSPFGVLNRPGSENARRAWQNRRMTPLKMLLFDLDGTIADTERIALGVLADFFESRGQPLSHSDIEALIGHPWAVVVDSLQKKYRLTTTPSALEKELLVEYRSRLGKGVPAIPGSVAAIEELSTAFRLVVVSGSRRQDIQRVLTSLKVDRYFERWFGFEDYSSGKPSPAPYLEAMQACGVSVAESMAFEDSVPGVQSGLAAGLRVVTVGPEPVPGQHRPPTPWSIRDFREVNVAWMRERFEK